MLVIAYIAGTVLAIVAARLTVPLLDPIEAIPPDPITVVPVVLVALAAPALLLVALAGGWLTERRARSADLGQVMRLFVLGAGGGGGAGRGPAARGARLET